MSRKCPIKFWIATAIFGALLIGRHEAHAAIAAGATAETWAAMDAEKRPDNQANPAVPSGVPREFRVIGPNWGIGASYTV